MRTATLAPCGQAVAARRRCASTAAVTAREAEEKTASMLSPTKSPTTPPAASVALLTACSCPSMTAPASEPSSRMSVVHPTMSV